MIYRSRYNFPSSLQTQSWKAEGNILSYELLILQDNFRTSNYYMHLRNKERVNQVLARDFCISALPVPGCGMVITAMQRCSTLRRVRRRHFGIQTCALFQRPKWSRGGHHIIFINLPSQLLSSLKLVIFLIYVYFDCLLENQIWTRPFSLIFETD